MIKIPIKLQSIIDVITNSSTEVYVMHNTSTVKYIYSILEKMLPGENVKSIFDVKLEKSDSDKESIYDNYISYMEEDLYDMYLNTVNENKSLSFIECFEKFASENDINVNTIMDNYEDRLSNITANIYVKDEKFKEYALLIENLLYSPGYEATYN